MSRLWGPLLDIRIPSPDPAGALADLQVRRHHWEAVATHVRDEWPDVRFIRCSFTGMSPTLTIHISPWSDEARFRHWPLTDWLRDVLPLDECEIHVLPHLPDGRATHGIGVFPEFTPAA